MGRCISPKAGAVSRRVVSVLAHGLAMKTIDKVERIGKFFVDESRRLDTTLIEEIFCATEKALSSLIHLPSRTMSRR